MITGRTSQKPNQLEGHYLTVGQDATHSIVSNALVIQRIPERVFGGADPEKRGKIMRTSVRTILPPDKEFASVTSLFENLPKG